MTPVGGFPEAGSVVVSDAARPSADDGCGASLAAAPPSRARRHVPLNSKNKGVEE